MFQMGKVGRVKCLIQQIIISHCYMPATVFCVGEITNIETRSLLYSTFSTRSFIKTRKQVIRMQAVGVKILDIQDARKAAGGHPSQTVASNGDFTKESLGES